MTQLTNSRIFRGREALLDFVWCSFIQTIFVRFVSKTHRPWPKIVWKGLSIVSLTDNTNVTSGPQLISRGRKSVLKTNEVHSKQIIGIWVRRTRVSESVSVSKVSISVRINENENSCPSSRPCPSSCSCPRVRIRPHVRVRACVHVRESVSELRSLY